uniref:Uncharacterized protein n=1 Tax=Cacopsylla melanoneura TaxID=428564 RepID=A0A8D9AD71_9HEMI
MSFRNHNYYVVCIRKWRNFFHYYTEPHRISAITPISTKVLSNHLFNRKKRQVFFSPFSNISVVLPRTSVLFKVLTLNMLIMMSCIILWMMDECNGQRPKEVL